MKLKTLKVMLIFAIIFSILFLASILMGSEQGKMTKNDIEWTKKSMKDLRELEALKRKGLKIGIASYYHDKYDGRLTANGEVFSQDSLTAAHRALKFGTYVKVSNMDNNRSVVVRINDRGPFIYNRDIDLSRKAFEMIADTNKGLIRVRIEIL